MLKPINRKIGLVLIGFALFYLILSFRLPEYPYAAIDADFVPKALGFLLLLLSVLLFFSKKPETEEEKNKRKIPDGEAKTLLTVCSFILVYIFFFELIGFVVMTALFIFITTWYLGYKKKWTNAIVSVVFSLSIYMMFNYLLQISLPAGILPF
jgi:putative tricarboxylic transport membrane protein